MPLMRHIPMRRCVACREARPKRDLLRFVAAENGDGYTLDLSQRAPGRGTSVCRECALAVLTKGDPARQRGFRRAFRQHADGVLALLLPLQAHLAVALNRPAGAVPVTQPTLSVSPRQSAANGAAPRPNGGMHG
jgi:predicted RNA-binding protein YlxR (DUF448 family)